MGRHPVGQARPHCIAAGRQPDIWIEEEDEHTGKPVIWYSLDSKGRKQKHVRNSLGVSICWDEETRFKQC